MLELQLKHLWYWLDVSGTMTPPKMMISIVLLYIRLVMIWIVPCPCICELVNYCSLFVFISLKSLDISRVLRIKLELF